MPVQYLYPTGISVAWNNWFNQSGHSFTNSNVGIKDIDEGIPSTDSDWLSSYTPYSANGYVLDILTGPLYVTPESVIFRQKYLYSGSTGSPTVEYIALSNTLYDARNNTFAYAPIQYITNNTAIASWTTKEISGTIYPNITEYDFSRTKYQLYLVGVSYLAGNPTNVANSGHFVSSIEICISGATLNKQSGIPLYLQGASNKNITIQPEGLYKENRWFGTYNYTGIFDLGYFKVEEGSGYAIYDKNRPTISGVYFNTSQGYQSGLVWHNKRPTPTADTTYGIGPKFAGVNDSAFILNSGILYNKNNFTVFARYFPSGSAFINNGSGIVVMTDALQDGTGTCRFKVMTDNNYTNFTLVMFTSGSLSSGTTSFNLDGSMGFDALVGYNNGSGYLYVQNHLGSMNSGIFPIATLRNDHRTKVSIGGIIPSGVS